MCRHLKTEYISVVIVKFLLKFYIITVSIEAVIRICCDHIIGNRYIFTLCIRCFFRFKTISVKLKVISGLTASKQTQHKQYSCYQYNNLFLHQSKTTHIVCSRLQSICIRSNAYNNSIISLTDQSSMTCRI